MAALREMEPGYALLVCPSGQEQRVAERIGQELVLCPPEPLTALFPPRPVGRALSLYAGLPTNAELGLLNGRRDLLLRWGHRVVFVTDLSGLSRLQQHAGDIWAVVQINLLLPYVLERVPEGQAISHYADELRQRYGRLDLRGFARSENEDVSWDTVSVYVPITVLVESRFGRFFIGFTDILETATRDGYVKHGEVMSLLGHPGSGKTFALRWLALTQMEALRPEGAVRAPLGSGVVPILLPLPTLLEFLPTFGPLRACQEVLLRQGQPLASLLDSLAVQGRIAFLLDGLDEVGDEGTRARVADAVEQLAADYPRCRVVASSRITGFADAPVKGTRLIIQPLGEEEVHQFLVGWCERYAVDQYGPTGKARGHTEGERLAQDVLDHPQVAALARSPLMLTVLAMVHRAGLRLPDHRVELYEHVTRILVERWNRLRGPPGPDHG
ncbi:MAG TPA: NACHT domain-containing protein, partial [Myxococcota bacterium]|nr:NACHT domain-containing protein [Myxococcota bacterium]